LASAPSEACPPESASFALTLEGTVQMIVIGTDTHKKTHTCGAIDALTASRA
jgi:hypothetical protein